MRQRLARSLTLLNRMFGVLLSQPTEELPLTKIALFDKFPVSVTLLWASCRQTLSEVASSEYALCLIATQATARRFAVQPTRTQLLTWCLYTFPAAALAPLCSFNHAKTTDQDGLVL